MSRISEQSSGGGCPYCSGKRVMIGDNDLATYCRNNELEYLLDEWAYDLNEKKPEEYLPLSNKIVKWRCKNDHVFPAQICSRVGQKSGCTICSHKEIIPGINDFLTEYPEFEKEVDWEANKEKGIDPRTLSYGNCKTKVIWKCIYGHSSYPMYVNQRIGRGQGCPECAKIKRAKAFSKRVRNIETGEEYESASEAKRVTGILHIAEACAGSLKSAGGYHWEYI
jgi:hypothetical protein